MRNRSLKVFSIVIIFSMVFGLFGSVTSPIHASNIIQAVDLTGTTYTQNFDTLANTGTPAWSNDSTITGWYLTADATPIVSTYLTGTGSGSTGGFYSFGSSGSTERAFGGLGSNGFSGGSGVGKGNIGLVIYNNTGANISQIDISYTGEQWRANNLAAQSLTFAYNTIAIAPLDASVFASTTTGWTNVSGLNFLSPNNTATSPYAVDGNLSANRAALSSSISGVTISPGTYILLRWTDLNDSGNDHGLAIDDLSITFTTSAVDTAPTVASTTPANMATDVAIDSNIDINFSEAVNVTGSWYSISCATSGTHTTTVTGGPTAFNLNPDSDFAYEEVCTVTVYATGVTDQDINDPPNYMAADYVFSFTTAANVCLQAYTPVYNIQGTGLTAAITGAVTTRGVVVGDFEGASPALRGFFLQDLTGDGDPASSDGIFVFNGNNNSVSNGDVVHVIGSAAEFQDQTQIGSVSSITKCGTGSVSPVDVMLPVPSATYLEQFEGMLVRLPQTLYVTEHFQLGRFGQVVLSSGARLEQPTNIALPGASAQAIQAANNLNRIIVDDTDNNQNADPIVFGRNGNQLSATNTLRGGDTASGITGIMTYTWGGNAASANAYRIRPLTALNGYINFAEVNSRPSGPPFTLAAVNVVGMNLLNYFDTFTGCTMGLGGAATDCRGANDAEEFERQAIKIVEAIKQMNADVVGLVELENDGYGADSAIADLVDRLNQAYGSDVYAYLDADLLTGEVNALGFDAIKVGMIYKPAMVTPIGDTAVLNTPAFLSGGDSDSRNRASLMQAFETPAGARFLVNVNHLKSKGTACDTPDLGDGQGNCNTVRLNAVNQLLTWYATDPTDTGDTDILVVGDLNSYAMEDPVRAFISAGFADMLNVFTDKSYSYVFDGQWGHLDYALASPSLIDQVTGSYAWHINSDEPSVLDYNKDFKSAGQIISLFAPDEFRLSDHDPIITGMILEKTILPVKGKEKEAVVAAEEGDGSETPTALPDTGFTPGLITALPQQSVEYSELGDLWLEIPALGVKTPITGVPLTEGSWDVTWLGSQAGWLEGSAFPTAPGNSVLTGHVWDALNRPGVFEKLADLRYGDQVIVHNAGKAYVYEVRERLQVSAGSVNQLLKHKDRAWVTLVTCRGFDEESGEYLSRVLVRAVLVDVK